MIKRVFIFNTAINVFFELLLEKQRDICNTHAYFHFNSGFNKVLACIAIAIRQNCVKIYAIKKINRVEELLKNV